MNLSRDELLTILYALTRLAKKDDDEELKKLIAKVQEQMDRSQ